MWSTTMDVAGWLRGLGLGEYEAVFRDNAIDEHILLHLTVEDLREIGVTTVGDRRKLLAAIGELAAPAPSTAPWSPPGPVERPRNLEVSAERRPITVMFCDLVGSTSLAAKLDAEDWRNLVNAYFDASSKAVIRFGGHVLKKLGDGLMALFGYPQAQEDDAERAVRAALAIQSAIAEINAHNSLVGAPELVARIGLESGPVIVDSAGEVFGAAPNVAARVQAVAEPGAILVTSTVQRQVAGLFVAEDKGAHELRGMPTPINLYGVLRASGGRRGKRARLPTPFVGREEEIDVLFRRWERTRAGEGQFVLITGEPGIGKSRLVEELRPRLGEIPHSWIEWGSSQLLRNTPLHPIVEWGRSRFGGAKVEPERRLAELRSALAQVGLDPTEYAPLLAPLLDISIAAEGRPDLPPDEMHRKQLAAVVDWAIAGARGQPVILVLEDLQWFDPSSLELIQAISHRGSEAPLLVLATSRPEFQPPWELLPHHSAISLTPLDAAQAQHIVAEIASRRDLSPELIKVLAERAGGVPLFVEEVTRLFVERSEHASVQAIPPTLRQSLAARLDRVGLAQGVAQIAAVLGRDFSYAFLRDVSSRAATNSGKPGRRTFDEASLQSALDRLVSADLLFIEGVPPEATYRFKHALFRDAAYDSLLKSRRIALHRLAGEALIEVRGEAEAVAFHFTEAGLDDLAVEWWGKAGDNALRRAAFKEAIAHLGKAIEIADRARHGAPQQGRSEADASSRLRLHTAYGQALMWSKGFAADDARIAYARLHELAAQAGDSKERNVVYYAQWIRAFIRGEVNLARDCAELLLHEAEASRQATDAVVAHRTLGLTYLFKGELTAARSHLERALADYVRERDVDARRLFGTDPGITARTFLALLAWLTGDVDAGRQLIVQAVKEGEDTGHIGMISTNRLFLTRFELNRDDPTATLQAAEALVTFARMHDIPLYTTYGEIFASWARGRLLDPETSANQLRRIVTDYLALGNKNSAPLFYGMIGDLQARAGQADSALASIDLALQQADETGERWWNSVLLRRKGEILLEFDTDDPKASEDAFRRAIRVAAHQGARSYGLIASLALAERYRSAGRDAEAGGLLASALRGFSPSPELPQVAEAQALLGRLPQKFQGSRRQWRRRV
jgi:class 3 adenylate cyclase/tetratricopeptide (TPR) repeat protein